MQIDDYRALFSPESFRRHRLDDDTWQLILFVRNLLLRKGTPVMVDVGAGVGVFSLLTMMLPNLTVHAFEPNLVAAQLLRENVQSAGVGNRVRIHEVALMHQPARAMLSIPIDGERDGLATLARQPSFAGRTVEVQCEALDNLNIGRADLLKLDVEGAELFTLRGASRWIEQYRPMIIAETQSIRAAQFGYDIELIDQWLERRGYKKYRLRRRDTCYYDDCGNTVI